MDKDLVKPNGKTYNYREDPTLNDMQKAHIRGEFNLYEPVEAYYQKWDHNKDPKTEKFISASPIEGTERRDNLPSISQQWRDDYRRRFCNV